MIKLNKFISITCLIGSIFVLSSCISKHHTIAHKMIAAKKTQHIAGGAAAGMVTGGMAGTVIGGFIYATPGFGAAIGSGFGLLAGTLHANANYIEKYHIHAVRMNNRLVLLIPTDRIFEPTTNNILPTAYPTLNLTVDILKHFPKDNIHLSANTDPIVPQNKDLEKDLSTQQAMTFAGYLWSHGINNRTYHRHLTYAGLGHNYPIATNRELTGMAKNRRIQITIYPNTKRACPDQYCSSDKCTC